MQLFGNGHRRTPPRCAAVIVAAGTSRRMQGQNKIMAELLGKPVIAYTVQAFETAECIDEIILVTRPEQVDRIKALMQEQGMRKVRMVIPGGVTRIQSVEKGLLSVSKGTELVAVQDGARPLVTPELIQRTVERARHSHAAAPAISVKDTIKVTDDAGRVLSTPERKMLRAVQTPQVFDRDLLLAAWEKARREGAVHTDDCGAMEAFGVPVYLTEGSEENIKLTTPLDLILAEELLRRRKEG